jgi:ferrous iron transport protein B
MGNPNSGKTTLFNFLSGSNEHVGNYSGVTVASKESKLKYKDYVIRLVDLPGTYSLSSYTPEEVYARNYIVDTMPDIVLNVLDAGNLQRNLFLTTQLIDMDLRIVAALNMYDDLEKKSVNFDYDFLGKMIGLPFVPTIAPKKIGLTNLLDKIIDVFEDREPVVRHIHINYGKAIEKAIQEIQKLIKTPDNYHIINTVSPRFIAIKLLEKDKEIETLLVHLSNSEEVRKMVDYRINKIALHLKKDTSTLVTEAKYGFIRGALKETYHENGIPTKDKTRGIDNFLTHKWLGFPFFIFMLWLMFQLTFWLGNYPMEWIDTAVNFVKTTISAYMSDGMFKDLLLDGIINGVGGVIIFLPNILILFFFISLMEDTGYMARAAFIMDKLMHKIGLHGKSFMPLIMGFGCNVPAIMATRTIENKNDRLLTILINPFMSCSARLPVYILITAAIFPEHAGNIIFLIYMIGIALAALLAILFKKIFFKKEETPFVMELPPYRLPTVVSTAKHMWHKAYQYLQKMGGIILIASVLVWALGYFPINEKRKIDFEKQKNILLSQKISLQQRDSLIHKIENKYTSERLYYSYIGRFGKAIEPALQPLGFDWRMGVAIISGIPAKEVIVSTMGVLFTDDNIAIQSQKRIDMSMKIRSQIYDSGIKKGSKLFTSSAAFSFLLFILIYFPCVATLAAVRKETASWKWPIFMFIYTTLLAYFVSFSFYQIAQLF